MQWGRERRSFRQGMTMATSKPSAGRRQLSLWVAVRCASRFWTAELSATLTPPLLGGCLRQPAAPVGVRLSTPRVDAIGGQHLFDRDIRRAAQPVVDRPEVLLGGVEQRLQAVDD